jgi:DNA-binding HxlR family transcriptional regulator
LKQLVSLISMKKPSLPDDHPCPVEAAMDVVGGRWKGVILYHLFTQGTLRYGELRRLLPPRASQQAVTNQLRELEADGVVHREVFRQVAPRVEYSLTSLGQSLKPLMLGLCEWGKAYQAHVAEAHGSLVA